MDESEFQSQLQEILENYSDWEDHTIFLEDKIVSRVQTFEDAGLLTNDAGLVVTLKTGEEFQLTIVRSR